MTSRPPRLGIVVVSLGLLAAVIVAPDRRASSASFTGLGHLAGDFFGVCVGSPKCSFANAVSADGKVVVGFSTSAAGKQAFLWQSGVMTGLGDLPGGSFASEARGVSADGSVVVGIGTPATAPAGGPFQAFRWKSGVMTNLGGLPGLPGQPPLASQAFAVSADGNVVVGGGQAATGGNEAFRWTQAGGMVGLGDLFTLYGPNSTARAVSSDGSVVAGQGYSTTGIEAFRWTQASGMAGLGRLPGATVSSAYGISADGLVVVGTSPVGTDHAFRWTQTTGMVAITGPPVIQSLARAASGNGSVVVGYSYVGPVDTDAFIWDAVHGLRRVKDVLVNDFGLTLTGWKLTEATGISSDGLTVVGNGTDPSGNAEAWIADLSGATPALASLVSADADEHGVRLQWFAPGAAFAGVYRRTMDRDWAMVASIPVDGGRVAYEDRLVEAGRRYGYRIGITGATGEEFFGEAWVTIPGAAALSLEGLRPNPGDRDLLVSFSLSSAGPAVVELVDLTGRVVVRRDVDAGQGSHVIRLEDGRSVAPGVYILRLTQDGRSVTRMASVVH